MPRGERGSAVVEHVLVLALLLLLALGIVQVTLLVHARAIAVASAAEGARAAAGVGTDAVAGGPAAEALLHAALGAAYSHGLRCAGADDRTGVVDEVRVECTGPIPLPVLGIGSVTIHVVGHAVREGAT
jgi:hypothetical protein